MKAFLVIEIFFVYLINEIISFNHSTYNTFIPSDSTNIPYSKLPNSSEQLKTYSSYQKESSLLEHLQKVPSDNVYKLKFNFDTDDNNHSIVQHKVNDTETSLSITIRIRSPFNLKPIFEHINLKNPSKIVIENASIMESLIETNQKTRISSKFVRITENISTHYSERKTLTFKKCNISRFDWRMISNYDSTKIYNSFIDLSDKSYQLSKDCHLILDNSTIIYLDNDSTTSKHICQELLDHFEEGNGVIIKDSYLR
jgi:hypothetical protein